MKTRLECSYRRLRGHLARFGANSSGNVAILFGVSAVVLLMAIGAAIDLGRWMNARDQTVAAIDAAVLAGARYLQTNPDDAAGAVAAAQTFYEQNVKTRLPVTGDTVTFSMADSDSMTASGTAYIKTPFLQFASIDKLPLISTSTAEFSKAQHKIGENLEISMMLDVTGSMAGQKLEDLKSAAKDLVNIIVGSGANDVTTKIALVPFSEDIRLPTTSALNKARGNNLPDTKTENTWWGPVTYYLSDCVVERMDSQKYTDAAPDSNPVTAHYTANYTTNGNGNSFGFGFGHGGGGGWGAGGKKTGVCTIPENSAITPLSTDASALKSKIDDLSASGGTAGHLGTAWAWYTLSPNWASLWPAQSRPVDYDTPNYKKIAILMTDGEYNTQYDSNGVAVDQGIGSCPDAQNGCSATQARALCSAMKNAGIVIYSVGFELGGPTSESYKTLQQCASDEKKFYTADSGTQLQQAFRDIGLKLSKLYLSK